MQNMAHCRFHNTLEALRECVDHLEDDLPLPEMKARNALIKLISEIASDYADD